MVALGYGSGKKQWNMVCSNQNVVSTSGVWIDLLQFSGSLPVKPLHPKVGYPIPTCMQRWEMRRYTVKCIVK